MLSSDALRAVVSGDEADQSATDDAFRLLHLILDLRLARGRLSVVDATNVERWARRLSVDVARRHRRPAAAIVFDLPLEACLEHNAHRADGRRPPAAIRRQHRWMRELRPTLGMEGFDPVVVLTSAEEAAAARVERMPPAGHANVPKEPRPSLR